MEILVLGTGCNSCRAVYENAKIAVTEMNLETDVRKEEDLMKILQYNILGLPALVLDGAVVSAGRRLSVMEIKELIMNHLNK